MATKESILVATLELASQKGLGAVSLSQIAKKVGIQKASLYSHFSSKDEIIDSLYKYLRTKAKNRQNIGEVDYGALVKGKTAVEVLRYALESYRKMNEDPDMMQFYRFIVSERPFEEEAAKIMVAETEKMILATKQLFYAMQVQHVMHFSNVDMAAFSYAMAVHSMIDYIEDKKTAGMCDDDDEKMIEDFIEEFVRIYGTE